MCRWVSTNPGMTIVFAASITCASAVMFGRTAAIWPFSISTSAVSKSPTFGSSERTHPPLSSMRPVCAAAGALRRLAATRAAETTESWTDSVMKSRHQLRPRFRPRHGGRIRAGYPTRVFVTLALASAAFYGAADFLGGIASKRADSVVVTFVAQAAGLVLLALLLPVLPSSSPVPSDYVWGAAAGVAGSAGVALPLSRARDWHDVDRRADHGGVRGGGSRARRAGARRAAWRRSRHVGIVLTADRDHAAESRSVGRRPIRGTSMATTSVGMALISGVAVGLFFLCLAQTSDEAGIWPLIVGRSVSVPLFGVMAVTRHRGASRWMELRVAGTAIGVRNGRYARERALSDCHAIRSAESGRDAGVSLSGEHGAAGAAHARRAPVTFAGARRRVRARRGRPDRRRLATSYGTNFINAWNHGTVASGALALLSKTTWRVVNFSP